MASKIPSNWFQVSEMYDEMVKTRDILIEHKDTTQFTEEEAKRINLAIQKLATLKSWDIEKYIGNPYGFNLDKQFAKAVSETHSDFKDVFEMLERDLKKEIKKKIAKLKRVTFQHSELRPMVNNITTRMDTAVHARAVHEIYSTLVRDIDKVIDMVSLYEGRATLVPMSEDFDFDDGLNLLPLEEDSGSVAAGRWLDEDYDRRNYTDAMAASAMEEDSGSVAAGRMLDEDYDRERHYTARAATGRRRKRGRNVEEERMFDKDVDRQLHATRTQKRQRRKR